MILAGNFNKAISKASSRSDVRETNGIVKFGLFCSRVEKNSCKAEC